MSNRKGSETRRRIRIAKILDASEVTSIDRGGLRRFKSNQHNKKWGAYSEKDGGRVIIRPLYDKISHYDEECGGWEAESYGKTEIITMDHLRLLNPPYVP